MKGGIASLAAGLSLAFTQPAEAKDTEFKLVIPGGFIVEVKCDTLGPGRRESVPFWRQFEPAKADLAPYKSLDVTNRFQVETQKAHLKEHGINDAFINAVGKKCDAVRSDGVRYRDIGPSPAKP